MQDKILCCVFNHLKIIFLSNIHNQFHVYHVTEDMNDHNSLYCGIVVF